jgi:DNA polymerase III alpha subunit (gram-positive type)
MPDIVVSDIAAQKIAASIDILTAAIGEISLVQNALQESTFGSTARGIPGTIPAILVAQAATHTDMLNAMGAQTKAINQVQQSIGNLGSELGKVTTAAANMQYIMTQQLITTEFMASDQIKNNKFQQLTTNAALERANLPKTEVKPDDMKTAVVNGFQDISVIRAQSTVISYASNAVTSAATEGLKITQTWAAQTALGKYLALYKQEAELSYQIMFAEGEAKRLLTEQRNAIRTARQTGGAST